MKTRLLIFLMVIVPFLAVKAQWSNYAENFDTYSNWQGSSPSAFGPQSYINGGAPENDVFSSNNARLLYNDGYVSFPYNWRLNLSITPVYFRYQTGATVESFNFYMSRLNLVEDPTIVIRYSKDSGVSWTEIETIGASWFPGTAYKNYSYTFPAPVYPDFGQSLIIEIYKTYGTYINIDDFSCSYAAACVWQGNDDGNWMKESNWSGGIPVAFSNVTIPGGVTNFPNIDEAAECYNLYILSGGSLINNSSLTINGEAYIFRDINGADEYHFISSPVSAANLGDIFPEEQGDNIWLRRYDEPSGNWVSLYIPAVLSAGTGYSFYMDEPSTTAVFSGTPNNSNLSPVLSYAGNTGDPDYDNWNLLGNPFTSALDWDLGSWNTNGLNGSVYVWDGSAGNYVSWNGSAGGLTNGIIPPQQGFFVKVENESAPSITIPLDARVHETQTLYKSTSSQVLELQVQNSVNSYSDKTFIEVNPDASDAFDTRYDAYKLDGNVDAPALYTSASGKRLSVNAVQQINENQSIPLYFKPGIEGSFTLSAPGIERFEAGSGILLEDLKTGILADLRSGNPYTFLAAPGDDLHRFNLVFGALGIENPGQLNASVFSNKKDIFIQSGNSANGRFTVCSLTGQIVLENTLSGNGLQTIHTTLPSGVYFVTVYASGSKLTRKVFIQ